MLIRWSTSGYNSNDYDKTNLDKFPLYWKKIWTWYIARPWPKFFEAFGFGLYTSAPEPSIFFYYDCSKFHKSSICYYSATLFALWTKQVFLSGKWKTRKLDIAGYS